LQRDVVAGVAMPVAVASAPCIFHQDGGAFGDAIDDAFVVSPIEAKPHARAWEDAELCAGPFAGGDQRVSVIGVAEQSPGDGLEARRPASRVPPGEHFGEVDEFVLEDALQSFEAMRAADPSDFDRAFDIAEG